MKRHGRGVVGRRVQLKGRAGEWTIKSISARYAGLDTLYHVRRKVCEGGITLNAVARRSDLKFVKGDYTAK